MVTITETVGDWAFSVSAETADQAVYVLRKANREPLQPKRDDLDGVIREIARLVGEIPKYFSACP